ncbi:pyridoxamine 5'-phosphate oxidase family protein [Nonomuraea sp. NPDC046570]|uniref:pyridoxamine 5'-phosphate oxidase family protein n=1 Tax=Nonomuraea sp. NPDC046570 TaxID=3155255 RepID=UPI0033FEAF9A
MRTGQARQINELSREQALELLGTVSLGRVVFTRNALPAIRPVNHIVDGEAIIIRSHLGAAIVSHSDGPRGAVVAYEADNLDPDAHLGWSVIVTGTAHIIREPAAIARYERLLRPWVAREMDYVISIHADMITGIELIPET